jgi:hypothetical protein
VYFPNTLTDGVTNVTEVSSPPFWHFCHPLTLGISKVGFPGKGAERSVIQYKRDPGWKPSRA